MAQDVPPVAQHRMPSVQPALLQVPQPRPSLIPPDVLQAAEREAQQSAAPFRDELEPTTAPISAGDDIPVFLEMSADPVATAALLAQVPLFLGLAPDTLAALCGDAEELEIPGNEALFAEGDEADCFYVLREGSVEVRRAQAGRELVTRRVVPGEAVGLLGLISDRVRTASARAVGRCGLVRLSGARLRARLEADDALHDRLLRYYRERLVDAFLSTRLFSDLGPSNRAAMAARFTHRALDGADVLLSPGEVANLLAVVTHGTLVIEDRSKGNQPRRIEIPQGSFVAVVSALAGVPGQLRISADGFATVSWLPHRAINECMQECPELRSLPARLASVARAMTRDAYWGSAGLSA